MKSEKSNHIDMNKRDLKKLSKSELIELLLKQEKKKPEIIVVDDYEPKYKPKPPVPTPRTIKPVPAPRTIKPVPAPRNIKPVPALRNIKPVPARLKEAYTNTS